MKNLNENKVCEILNEIMEYELAGVVRYTHSSLMVSGPNRIPIVEFLQAQATESLLHAQQAGELITGLDGHPSQKIAKINESNRHSINDILNESLEHEIHALNLYKKLPLEKHIKNCNDVWNSKKGKEYRAQLEQHGGRYLIKNLGDYQVVDSKKLKK